MSEHRLKLSDKLRKAVFQLQYLPRAIALAWDGAGPLMLAWALLLVLQGLLPITVVYLTRTVVDRSVLVFDSHGDPQSLAGVAVPVSALVGVYLIGELLRAACSWVRTAQAELVQDHVTGLIHRQSLAADLAFYETPEFYDHLHRARMNETHGPTALVETLGSVVQNAITLVAMGVVLIPFGMWLPAILILGTMPMLLVAVYYAAERHDWRHRNAAEERRALYCDAIVTSGSAAAELRLFNLGGHFQSAYGTVRARLRRERLRAVRRESLAWMGAAVSASAIAAAAIGWMAWRAVRGLVSLGDLAFFYQAFHQGLNLTRSLLGDVGQFYANSLFLGNLFEFLDLEPRVISPPSPAPVPVHLQSGIRFAGVRFRYPGNGRLALDDFNLFIPAGRIVAIVGPNGAGKSTLLKLLCRFYDPEEGRITIDGIDLRELDLDELRQRMTVLFQHPVRFNGSARDNIAFGDLSNASNHRVEAAARAAGADRAIERLEAGYDNVLGRAFAHGAELSGGEWQRIGLARALVRPAPVIILDEPTGAMDPWAEAEWASRFRAVAVGRTAIVITHRLTTALLSDEIHLMEGGRVTESGAHEELLARRSRYADWWTAQGAFAETLPCEYTEALRCSDVS